MASIHDQGHRHTPDSQRRTPRSQRDQDDATLEGIQREGLVKHPKEGLSMRQKIGLGATAAVVFGAGALGINALTSDGADEDNTPWHGPRPGEVAVEPEIVRQNDFSHAEWVQLNTMCLETGSLTFDLFEQDVANLSQEDADRVRNIMNGIAQMSDPTEQRSECGNLANNVMKALNP